MNKELNIRVLSHPAIMGSGVYGAVFAVDGEVVEREFEVDIITTYDYDRDDNCYNLRDVTVTTICCNEEDEEVADIMEYKLEEAIENCMWSK